MLFGGVDHFGKGLESGLFGSPVMVGGGARDFRLRLLQGAKVHIENIKGAFVIVTLEAIPNGMGNEVMVCQLLGGAVDVDHGGRP